MSKKISFSNEHSKVDDIRKFYANSEASANSFFTTSNNNFIGYSNAELERELREHKNIIDRMCSLEMLSMLEARFKIDYHIRCQYKKKMSFQKNLGQYIKKKNAFLWLKIFYILGGLLILSIRKS